MASASSGSRPVRWHTSSRLVAGWTIRRRPPARPPRALAAAGPERARSPRAAQRHRQRAADRPQLAGQRQLAGEFVAPEHRAASWPRQQHAQRDRQVEAAALLGQVRRREVDGDAPRREIEPQFAAPRAPGRALSLPRLPADPTMVKAGRPLARCTSTVTGGASMPTRRPAVYRTASDIAGTSQATADDDAREPGRWNQLRRARRPMHSVAWPRRCRRSLRRAGLA